MIEAGKLKRVSASMRIDLFTFLVRFSVRAAQINEEVERYLSDEQIRALEAGISNQTLEELADTVIVK